MVLNILIDLLLSIIFICGIVYGVKNGFIKTSSRPLKIILTLVFSIYLASPVGNLLIKPVLSEPIASQISSYLTVNYADITAQTAEESLPTVIKLAAGYCGVTVDQLATGADSREIIGNIVTKLSDPIVGMISVGLAFILLYLLFKLAFSFCISLINGIFDRGIVGTANKILGGVFMSGIVFAGVWTGVCVFEFLIHLPLFSSYDLFYGFEGGVIYRFIKSVNPLDLILSF